MNRILTPFSLLMIRTLLSQAKSQFRHVRPGEITAAERLFYIIVPWSYQLFTEVTIHRRASSQEYYNILQNIRERSGWYQHSQYTNFHKNSQQSFSPNTVLVPIHPLPSGEWQPNPQGHSVYLGREGVCRKPANWMNTLPPGLDFSLGANDCQRTNLIKISFSPNSKAR